jgi:hypothetical protein
MLCASALPPAPRDKQRSGEVNFRPRLILSEVEGPNRVPGPICPISVSNSFVKKLRAALLAVMILMLVLCAYIPIQQQILRHRAEKLLADIRILQLRKSTWADAQILMKRWGAWGHYEGDSVQRSWRTRRWGDCKRRCT